MPAALKSSHQGETKLLFATGNWVIDEAARLDRELALAEKEIANGDARSAKINLEQLHELDTAGAWLLTRLIQCFGQNGIRHELVDAKPHHAALLDRIDAGHPEPAIDLPGQPALQRMIGHLGEVTCHVWTQTFEFVSFIGSVVVALAVGIVKPATLRWNAISHHLETTGINALPIVGLMSFLIGVVLAYQGSSQLVRFGAEIFTIDLLGVSVMRELGVLMTAIIVAGRSGSAFTAQIGTMQINQETDAMRVIGLDPIRALVLPRVLALLIAMPVLVVVAVILAFVGGALVVIFGLDIPTIQFMRQISSAVSFEIFMAGMVKAPVFAFIIATVGCYKGLQVSGSADSVGRLTTESVVVSIFLVIVVDALFSIVFAALGI